MTAAREATSSQPIGDHTALLSPRPSVSEVERWLVRRLRRLTGEPAIDIELWDGECLPARSDGRSFGRIRINDRQTLWRLWPDPQLKFGEAYSDGRIDVDGDLAETLGELNRSLSQSQSQQSAWWWHLPSRLIGALQHRSANHNVHHHYDLGNDFYRLWLDEQLVYTCAYFADPEMSLEEAQVAKFEHVCRKLRLQPGERVIEAGCGWGGLAIHMARQYGVSVRALNLSHEQIVEARRLAKLAGVSDRVEFIEDDWRNITGQCDAFVSIGMLEHVGLKNYRRLGRLMDHCLTSSGRGLIHSIGMNSPRPMDRWTERYIFPGAQPPSLSQMTKLFEPFNFSVLDVENLRLHYAETLRHWLGRFERSTDKVRDMFDEKFVRMWRLYLAGSVATFETGWLQLFQVLFARGCSNDVPRTREYQYPGHQACGET
ncbi:methyltransferase domain-containing protein [bacterium]|nr:methyltransferase domain-containing protein [bacterium]